MVDLPTGGAARAVIGRYTDRLPPEPTFAKMDLHELCHAVAVVQGLDDPCHIGNGGTAPKALFGR